MSVKIFDTMTTATPNFPLAYAEKINVKLQDGTEDNLQSLFDNGELGGGDDSVTLTQQEYEALSEEQKLDGLYYTYDTKRIYKNGVQYGASDAEGIGYNNAESGIQATTVQGAIDKVVKTVEDAYAKKTDIPTSLPANGGNADTVNNHIVKSDVPENAVFTDTVLEVNDTDVSETTVWSSKKTSGEIAKKVGKTDIATIIDGTSTDTQVPSAKAVWNKSKNNIQVLTGADIIAYADSISNEMVTDTVRIMNATNSPYGVNQTNNDFHYTIYNITDDKFKRILAYDIRENDMYMIMKKDGVWGTWAELATMDKVDRYSNSEIPIGTWINGKPIYRKVIINTENITGTTPVWGGLQSTVAGLNINKCVASYAILEDGGLRYLQFLPSSGFISYYSGVPNGSMVVMEYTKTTDA